jgi:hypothetical protein
MDAGGTAVISQTTNMNESDTITLMEGFDAIQIFLETVLRRHGKRDEELEFILGGLSWSDGAPADPIMWGDWLAAVQAARSGGSR